MQPRETSASVVDLAATALTSVDLDPPPPYVARARVIDDLLSGTQQRQLRRIAMALGTVVTMSGATALISQAASLMTATSTSGSALATSQTAARTTVSVGQSLDRAASNRVEPPMARDANMIF